MIIIYAKVLDKIMTKFTQGCRKNRGTYVDQSETPIVYYCMITVTFKSFKTSQNIFFKILRDKIRGADFPRNGSSLFTSFYPEKKETIGGKPTIFKQKIVIKLPAAQVTDYPDNTVNILFSFLDNLLEDAQLQDS